MIFKDFRAEKNIQSLFGLLNVQFQEISLPPPQKVYGNSKGEGVAKEKVFKEKYAAELGEQGWCSGESTLAFHQSVLGSIPRLGVTWHHTASYISPLSKNQCLI